MKEPGCDIEHWVTDMKLGMGSVDVVVGIAHYRRGIYVI
jgi:hypothetical protein